MQASRSSILLVLAVLTALLPPSWAGAEPYGTSRRSLIDVSDCEASGPDAITLCVNADIDATGALRGCSFSYGDTNCTCALCTTSDGKGGFSYDCSQVSASSAEEGSSNSSSSGGNSTSAGGPTMGCMEFSDHAGDTPTSSALSHPTHWPIGTVVCSLFVAMATVGLAYGLP